MNLTRKLSFLAKRAYQITAQLGPKNTLRLLWVIFFRWNPPYSPDNDVLHTDLIAGFEFDPHPNSWPNMIIAGLIQDYALLGYTIPSVVQSGVEQATNWNCANTAVVFQGHIRIDSYELARQVDAISQSQNRHWKKAALFAYEFQALRCKWIFESMGYKVIIPNKVMLIPANSFFKWGHQLRTRFIPLWRCWEILTRIHHLLYGHIDPKVML